MGIMIIYCGAVVVYYKSRLTSMVPVSSTEAKFLTTVFTTKLVKYFWYILMDLDNLLTSIDKSIIPLGLTQKKPTQMIIDNEAALNIINECRMTPRAHHISIQNMAIQEWKANSNIHMEHLPGTVNMADDLTKALTWICHSRHTHCSMGHYGPPSDPPS